MILFGEKLFAFTDQLDSINRLYYQMLDAEGLQETFYGIVENINKYPNNIK